jgi:hypothetical protein
MIMIAPYGVIVLCFGDGSLLQQGAVAIGNGLRLLSEQ